MIVDSHALKHGEPCVPDADDFLADGQCRCISLSHIDNEPPRLRGRLDYDRHRIRHRPDDLGNLARGHDCRPRCTPCSQERIGVPKKELAQARAERAAMG